MRSLLSFLTILSVFVFLSPPQAKAIELCSAYSIDGCGGTPIGNPCQLNRKATCQPTGSNGGCFCDPSITPTPTPSPVYTTPVLTPTPSPTPLPTPTATTETNSPCDNRSVYPPNSECYPQVEEVETEIDLYPLSCISAPGVTYTDTFTGFLPPSYVDVTVTHDLSGATLGGYGPDLNTMIKAGTPDNLAKLYLFNGLFDKPNYSLEETPREAWRTYWRLLTAKQQANVKAAYLKAIDDQQKNVYWHYYDKNGNDHETHAKDLRGELPGCLKETPVCEDFAKEYDKLSQNTKYKYDTLLPYNFDNLRSFIVLGGAVARENIPYLEAILSGISGENGLFSHLTPSWSVGNPEELPTTSNEGSLLSKVIARASSVACAPPQKAYGLPAPKTYPSATSLQQVVRVPVSATIVNKQPDFCEGAYYYCEYLNTKTLCEANYCRWVKGETEYAITGTATGRPIAVLNNPKVDQITDMVLGNIEKKIPSFFKMLLPSFAQIPDKSTITAPTVSNSTSPQASVNGATTIYRENNLAQDSMQILQSCWAVPASSQRSSKCSLSKVEVGPFECPTDCAATPPDTTTALSFQAKFTDLATRWLGVGHPRVENFTTVVNSAVAAGVDPVFALTIWLNESNASNYEGICQKMGGGNPSAGYCQRILDFGINLDRIASNPTTKQYYFKEQLSHFLGLPGYYKSACKAEMESTQCPMRVFMAMFLVGQCEPSAPSDGYYNHIKKLYEEWLAPGFKFPCYPTAYP